MDKRPIAGVLPLFDDGRESVWMLPGYLDCLQEAGLFPVVLPASMDAQEIAQTVEMCDGLLFTGGHDVEPALYGAETSPLCGAVCPARDFSAKTARTCSNVSAGFSGVLASSVVLNC